MNPRPQQTLLAKKGQFQALRCVTGSREVREAGHRGEGKRSSQTVPPQVAEIFKERAP